MYPFKSLLTACLLLSLYSAPAQDGHQSDTLKANTKDLGAVEIEASYPGGEEAWKKFLQKNLNANTPVKNNAPIGKYMAIVRFIVDKDGSTSNVTAETKFGYGMEYEVVRVIELSGKWTPATSNGKPLRAYRRQPVTFLLEDDGIEISTQEPYTLFTNTDNEITIKVKKLKPADISITVQGGKSIPVSDGKFIVRVNKPGRVNIEIMNNKKDDKEIATASFEVKAK